MHKAKPAIKTEVIPYIFYHDVPAALGAAGQRPKQFAGAKSIF